MSLGSYQSRRISLFGLRNKQTNTQTDRQRDKHTDSRTDGQKVRSRREILITTAIVCGGLWTRCVCTGSGSGSGALAIIYINTITTQRHCTCIIVCCVFAMSIAKERSPDREGGRSRQRVLQTATGIVSCSRTRSWVLCALSLSLSGLVCILIYWNHVSESILIQIHFRSQRCDTPDATRRNA